MDQRVQVLIVDHEVHTRQGLQALLAAWPEIKVVGAAANSVEAVQLVEKCPPDVALMDIPMPVPALPALDGGPGARPKRWMDWKRSASSKAGGRRSGLWC